MRCKVYWVVQRCESNAVRRHKTSSLNAEIWQWDNWSAKSKGRVYNLFFFSFVLSPLFLKIHTKDVSVPLLWDLPSVAIPCRCITKKQTLTGSASNVGYICIYIYIYVICCGTFCALKKSPITHRAFLFLSFGFFNLHTYYFLRYTREWTRHADVNVCTVYVYRNRKVTILSAMDEQNT